MVEKRQIIDIDKKKKTDKYNEEKNNETVADDVNFK